MGRAWLGYLSGLMAISTRERGLSSLRRLQVALQPADRRLALQSCKRCRSSQSVRVKFCIVAEGGRILPAPVADHEWDTASGHAFCGQRADSRRTGRRPLAYCKRAFSIAFVRPGLEGTRSAHSSTLLGVGGRSAGRLVSTTKCRLGGGRERLIWPRRLDFGSTSSS